MTPRVRVWIVALAVALASAVVHGQDATLPAPATVDGLAAGPFYLLPFFGLSVAEESNPFYQPDPQSDVVARANPALGVMLPFGHSYARLFGDATFRKYAKTEATETRSTDLSAELSLMFRSFDRLVMRADRTDGASELLRFDGGETTYSGTPFRLAIYTVGAERNAPGHLGYQVVATESRLTFDETDVDFFEFDGYDITADANVPVSSSRWIVAGLRQRRYDHFKADDPTHAVYRQEEADAIRLGLIGLLPSNGSYRVVLAYDRQRYPGGVGSDFTGLIGDASVDWSVGPATSVTVALGRRPWSSFFGDNNYYMANTVHGAMRHEFVGGSDVEAHADLGRSNYPDPFSIAAGGETRRDRSFRTGASVTIAPRRLYGLRVGYDAELRRSNIDGADYTAHALGVQFIMGWR